MEDFLTSFFITPFTGLAEGIATATSPLDVIDAVDGFVWGPIMILLLLGTHIFMTIRTGFIQRKIGTGIKLSVTKDDPSNADGDITQFGALTTALAATIGTGNIVGVGTGLLFGGPGAIFWMWITGILGIATKYSEVFIGVKYRVKDHSGKMLGGAMYALERGFKNKKAGRILAILFALFASLAAFGIGASTQSNSLADALYTTSLIDGKAIPQWLVGAVVDHHPGPAVRLQARHLLQRVRPGLRPAGRLLRYHEEPRTSGARFHDWHVLGYRRGVRHHRPDAHDHAAGEPRAFHGHR